MGSPLLASGGACHVAKSRTCSKRKLAGPLLSALLWVSVAPQPVQAADLPSVSAEVRPAEVGPESGIAPKAGTLRAVLNWSLKLLKWLLKYVPSLIGAVEGIEELLRVMDDAKRAAEAHKKLDDLSKRLADLEATLKQDRSAKAANARVIIRTLRTEIDKRPPYKSCGVSAHRLPGGTCADRRKLDTSTLPD
jgi:hypothetical protein